MRTPTPPPIPDGPLTFADYFKLNVKIQDVLAWHGHTYRMESCKLPRKPFGNGRLPQVRRTMERGLPHVNLIGETARRPTSRRSPPSSMASSPSHRPMTDA